MKFGSRRPDNLVDQQLAAWADAFASQVALQLSLVHTRGARYLANAAVRYRRRLRGLRGAAR